MRSRAEVLEVLALREQTGLGARRIAAQTGLPIWTVRDWLAGGPAAGSQSSASGRDLPALRSGQAPLLRSAAAYVYLLGLYLGDGSIATVPRGVHKLRISLDARYPQIIETCVDAMRQVMPQNRSGLTSCGTGTWFEAWCYSKAWPCLFPQHGPGKKHERPIWLTDWQTALVNRWPEQLLRGLIQSDGCRFINTGTKWICPRYMFSNTSDDIRHIFCGACDLLGLRYTFAPNKVYVSRKADVARLDEFIGPKR